MSGELTPSATPFHATDQHQQRRFYMTSCGHVLCDDTSHNRGFSSPSCSADPPDRNGTCTYCSRQGVAYTLLEEGLSPSLLRWFQPAAQSFEGIGESFSVLKVRCSGAPTIDSPRSFNMANSSASPARRGKGLNSIKCVDSCIDGSSWQLTCSPSLTR